jgi:hypothetical protein
MTVCLGACLIWKTVALAQATNTQQSTIKAPARIALVPGISSQGKNDKYTTSNFSLNVLGGTTGGVNGVELGSLFNIDKKNMQGVQAAGYFNITGGDVNGIQMAGYFNSTKGNLTGIQLAGDINYIKGNTRGLQASGLYNQISGSLTGAQMAGICNYTREPVKGLQLAGIVNINNSSITGLQASGILNYTKHLKGLQLGLINIADTSDGYSIGLINIVRKGYHKITLSSNEVLNTNLTIKTGNARMYNILLIGVNAGNDEKSFSYGYGIGHEIKAGKRFTINPELTSQYLYLGDWDCLNLLNKFQVLATVKITNGLALFAGPSFAAYYSEQPAAVKGYKYLMPDDNYHTFDLWNKNVTGWIGWTAGISFL